MPVRARSPFAVACTLLAVMASRPAFAIDKEQCVASYEETQKLRKASHLIEARTQALLCAQDACPGFVRAECSSWAASIDEATPTLVFEARDADGNDLFDVTVALDAAPLAAKLDGKAVAVDPGPHTLRFGATGYDAEEQRLIAREGEKGRVVAIRLRKAAAAPATTPMEPRSPQDNGARKDAPERKTPLYVWGLGGAGVVGLSTFAFFALRASSQQSTLDGRNCKPHCLPADVSLVKRNYVIADVALVTGVAALGAAAFLYFWHPSQKDAKRAATWRFDVAPILGGAAASAGARF